MARALSKQQIQIPEPVTNGGRGTIVVTDVPQLAPSRGVPRGVTGRRGDILKPARDVRVRLSLALKGFENDPSVARFSQVTGLLTDFQRAVVRLRIKIRRRSPDAAEDVVFSVREGGNGVRAARAWLRQGDFDNALKYLKLARDHFDEAFGTLQRVVPAVFRR